MEASAWFAEGIQSEYRGAKFGDKRLERRLMFVADRLGGRPGESFPNVFDSGAALEGFYRFVRNDAVDEASVLEPHKNATFLRASGQKEVLAIHDTTLFSFTGKRAGLGVTNTSSEGFYLHASLLVSADGARIPLGVGASREFIRTRLKHHRTFASRALDPNNEGRRWWEGIREVERRTNRPGQVIHIADREADAYDVLAACIEHGFRFIIRGRKNRAIIQDGKAVNLSQIAHKMRPQIVRKVLVSSRGKQVGRRSKANPKREGRVAHLAIATSAVQMSAPLASHKGQPPLPLNLIRVWEPKAPNGEEPIEWILWTTDPVDSEAQLEAAVDRYRARWVIEEFFKALKSGCQFERRQLESRGTLSVALALFMPIAWRLLLARTLARSAPASSPTEVFTSLELAVLEAHFGTIKTLKQAFESVALLGGHLSQNGDPGWITLGRGFEKLATFQTIAHRLLASRSDQS